MNENLLLPNLVNVTRNEQDAKKSDAPDGEEEKGKVALELSEEICEHGREINHGLSLRQIGFRAPGKTFPREAPMR